MNTPALDVLETRKLATGVTPPAPTLSLMQHIKADPINSINAGVGVAGLASQFMQSGSSGGDSARRRRNSPDGMMPMPAN